MNDPREGAPNPVPQLLVMEAISEFEAHFHDCPEKGNRLDIEVSRLGRKPGFSATSQLLRSSNDIGDTLKDIAEFLAGRFSTALFDVPAKPTIQKDVLKLAFADRLPGWFASLVVQPGQVLEEQQLWFRGFAQFVIGLYSGALLHFGYRLIGPGLYDFTAGVLTFSLRVEKLDAVWEFGGNFH
jgi:hypothetical protein